MASWIQRFKYDASRQHTGTLSSLNRHGKIPVQGNGTAALIYRTFSFQDCCKLGTDRFKVRQPAHPFLTNRSMLAGKGLCFMAAQPLSSTE